MATDTRRCDWCDSLYHPNPTIGGTARFCSRKCLYADRRVPLEAIYQRDGGICHLCGHHVAWRQASKDHLRPRNHGGQTTWANIALAHRRCNSERKSKPLAGLASRIPAIPRLLVSRRRPLASRG